MAGPSCGWLGQVNNLVPLSVNIFSPGWGWEIFEGMCPNSRWVLEKFVRVWKP